MPEGDWLSLRRGLYNSLAYSLFAVLAFILIYPHLSPLAVIGPDVGEYIYCVHHKCLPHAPYILYLWLGFLLEPFVRLDWGYTGVSVISLIGGAILFGKSIERHYGSTVAGWIASLVIGITPVCIRYAGHQEIYAFQFFFIAACWYFAVHRDPLLCGVLFGCAMCAHSGSIFALPSLVVLYAQARDSDLGGPTDGRPFRWRLPDWVISRKGGRAGVGPRLGGFRALPPRMREWAEMAFGTGLPAAPVLGWVLAIWISAYGIVGLPLVLLVLRGASPRPYWEKIFDANGLHWLAGEADRIWDTMRSFEVIGTNLVQIGGLVLLLLPLRLSLPWLLLAIPYLIYETSVGIGSIDWGIYMVFVVPALAAAVGLGVTGYRQTGPLRWIAAPRTGLALVALATALLALPPFQDTARLRNLLPWYRETGECKVLSDWVRENTRPDSLVIQPTAWVYAGLSSTLYTDRTPIFKNGYTLIPGPWKPLNVSPVFKHGRELETEDFERWLKASRSILSFDSDPFHSKMSWLRLVDVHQYETRPILWLDQNQTGTSRFLKHRHSLARVDVGDATSERAYDVVYPATSQWAFMELPVFRPTLYAVARKSDPAGLPEWAVQLQEEVPHSQRGGPPLQVHNGIAFASAEGFLQARLPVEKGRDHLLSLWLQSEGADYIIECQVQIGDEWVPVCRDMELIEVEPFRRYTELCFPVTAGFIRGESINVRLVPVEGTDYLNCYFLEWFAEGS